MAARTDNPGTDADPVGTTTLTDPADAGPDATSPTATVATQPGTGAKGKTVIADVVVSKIAGITTREIAGVHALGGSATRAVSALRERIPGSSVNHSQGISVEVGEKQAAIDVEIVAEYGVSIVDLAAGIRRGVISAIERTTGLEVVEVNITVHDIFVNGDEPTSGADTPASTARVV